MFGAAFAGFALLFVLATLPSIYLLDLKVLDYLELGGTRKFIMLCVAVYLVTGLFGLTVARFSLRVVPVRFGTRVQTRALVLGVLALLLLTVFSWVAVFSPSEDVSSNASHGFWFQSSAPEEVRIAGAIAVMVFAACAVIPFLWRHARPTAFLDYPFVLYLRRFSTCADRSVMNEVLRANASGKPIVFLTPTRGAIRDWNPFQIGFAGLRLRKPVGSLPIPVRTDDVSWQSAARELIQAAQTIVLDASEGSASILAEAQLIGSLNKWHKTVVLRTGQEKPDDSTEKEFLASRPVEVIHYERNWRRAMPRLLLGPVVSIIPAMWLAALITIVVTFLLSFFAIVGADLHLRFQQFLSQEAGTRVLLTLTATLAVWVYLVLFWRPAINKEAAVALARRLEKMHQSGTP